MGGAAGVLLLLIMSMVAAPEVILNPATARPGQMVTVNGTGFGSCVVSDKPGGPGISADGVPSSTPPPPPVNVTITVRWDGYDGNKMLATAKLQRDEKTDDYVFQATFAVPSDLRPGSYTVAAECPDPSGDPNAPEGEIGYDDLNVVGASPVPTPDPVDPTPSVTSPTLGGQGPLPVPTPPTVNPTPSVTSTPGTLYPGGTGNSGRQSPVGPIVAVVAATVLVGLVALALLRRRASRGRTSPAPEPPKPPQPPRTPTLAAVPVAGPPGSLELRRTGSDRGCAIRLVPHDDPGVRVVQRIGR